VVAAPACAGGERSPAERGQIDSGQPAPGGDGAAVVVTSFDFDESRLLAEIYAQAIEGAGVEVRREVGLGRRELVLPAIQQGLVDLVPEYLGSALAALDPGTDLDWGDAPAVRRALAGAAGRWGLEPLEPARAQNSNTLAVTRAFAYQHGLGQVSDLRGIAPTMRIGGPAECPGRPLCLPGLEEVYGLSFQGFVTVDGSDRVVRALQEGVVEVGVMFTTDGMLADPALVALRDDRGLQPAENVVPLVRSEALERHGPRLSAALDEVSGRLTTPMLQFLNWRVSVAGNDPADEARGWLLRQGIIDRS
jgi:osmoprotectant transport system substrate-binding protein